MDYIIWLYLMVNNLKITAEYLNNKSNIKMVIFKRIIIYKAQYYIFYGLIFPFRSCGFQTAVRKSVKPVFLIVHRCVPIITIKCIMVQLWALRFTKNIYVHIMCVYLGQKWGWSMLLTINILRCNRYVLLCRPMAIIIQVLLFRNLPVRNWN